MISSLMYSVNVRTWDGEWSNSSLYCSCISGLEVFIINSGVDVSLVAQELNSSSEEQEYKNTHIKSFANV